MEHPDEMPTDPAEIEKIVDGTSIEGSSPDDAGIDASGDPEVTGEDLKDPDPPKDEPKPQGVLAKDGKHVLPFSVLENTRAKNLELQELARQQAEEIERLKAGKDANPDNAELFSEEMLTALEEEGPAMAAIAKTMRAQQEAIQKLTAEAEARRNAAEQAEQKKAATTVQEAIDANAALAEWQSAQSDSPEAQARWEHALKVDSMLRELPAWSNKPMSERFAEVQLRVQRDFGDEVTNPSADQSKSAGKPASKTAAPSRRDRDDGPMTLSDLPGGIAPDSGSNYDAMDTSALAIAMEKMSQAQIDAILMKVA